MTRIGLLSDTHGYWDERYAAHLADVDQIWHAGDIGSTEVAEKLAALHPLKAVLIKHIGGYPGRYDRSVVGILTTRPPKLFISGHSHILKVQYDQRLGLLHINPGAAGLQGWQKVRTLVRFDINGATIENLEVIELR